MSKKHRSRRKMKPYQVKLRIIGIMSIIVSLLVLWLPLPSKAVDATTKTSWQDSFEYERETVSAIDYIDLKKYKGTQSDAPSSKPEESALIAPGMLVIPDGAVLDPITPGSFVKHIPRIGKDNAAVFQNINWLRRIDLGNVTVNESVTTFADLFNGATALEEVVFPEKAEMDSSKVVSTANMFKGCTSLKYLDLSMFDFSSLTTAGAQGMLDSCTNLDVIETPVNVSAEVILPGWFRFKGNDNNYYDVNHLLTAADHNAGSGTAAQSFTLTRVRDIESLEVKEAEQEIVTVSGTGTDTVEKDGALSIDVDDTKTISVKLSPATADNLDATVTITTGSSNVALDTTGFSIASDGTATFTLRGTAEGAATLRIEAKSNSGGRDVYRNANIDVNVQEQKVKVEGISLDKTDVTIDAAAATPTTLTASITPLNADNQNVKWQSDNEGVVKVTGSGTDNKTGTLSPVSIGTATITAISEGDNSKTATCTVTVTSTFTLTPDDDRSDAINHVSYTTITNVTKPPVKGNRTLEIKTPASPTLASTFSSVADDHKSFFTLAVTDGTNPVNTSTDEDYGSVTVQMPLPGKMWGKQGLNPQIVAASGSGTSNVGAKRITLNDYVEGVEFTIPIGALAPEYAIILSDQRNNLKISVQDGRTDPSVKAVATKTDKTTQNQDLILHIEDVTADAANRAPKLYNYVQGHSTYKDYAAKHYYLIWLTDGQNNTVNDFLELDVSLSLPSDVTTQSPYFTFLTEKADGTAAAQPGYTQVNVGAAEGVQFRPTHFSEFAALDHTQAAAVYTISTYHSGAGSSATVTTISGNDATTITTVTGADATATVPQGTNETVTVTATTPANSGYVFSHWTEGTSSTTPVTNSDGTPAGAVYTFTPTGNRILNAVFVEDTTPTPTPTPTDTYTVAIDRLPSAGGTASADKNAYQAGETATVTASPAEGYVFRFWADETGAPISQELTTTVTVNGNRRLYAVFDRASDVAGAGRTADAVVNVNVPAINVPAPQVNVPAPQVSVNVPAVNVNIPAINVHAGTGMTHAHAGTSATFHPLAFHRPGNYADMPRTGTVSMYRVMLTIILLMSGTVEVLLSIPAKKKRRMRTG